MNQSTLRQFQVSDAEEASRLEELYLSVSPGSGHSVNLRQTNRTDAKAIISPSSWVASLVFHVGLIAALVLPYWSRAAQGEKVMYVNLLEEDEGEGSGGIGNGLPPGTGPETGPTQLAKAEPQQIAKPPIVSPKRPKPVKREVARPKKPAEAPADKIEMNTKNAATASFPAAQTNSSEFSASASGGAENSVGDSQGESSGTGTGTGFGNGRGNGQGVGLGKGSKYGHRLAAWLEKHKQYPEEARLRGAKGDALLRVRIGRDGKVIQHEVLQSAGDPILDTAVEQLISRADPFPPVPEEYSVSEVEFIVPVRFRLH